MASRFQNPRGLPIPTSSPRLRTLGGLALEGADPRFARGPKRALLLTYLAVERPGALVPREVLLSLFWPHREAASARHALRNTLHSIRKVLGRGAVVSGGMDAVGLAPDALWCDAVEFDAATRNGRGTVDDQNLALYRGPFLDGFAPGDVNASLEQWVDARRGRLARAFASALEHRAADAMAAGNASAAIPHLRALVDLDPLAEAPVASLLRALVELGRHPDASRLARRFVMRLRRETGRAPSPDFEAQLGELVPRGEGLTLPEATPMPKELGEHTLVGRRNELGQLRDAWERASMGRPQVVVIAGEAGIGKTRLAEELLGEVANAGARVARTRSWAAEGRLAYGPLADVLRAPPLRRTIPLLAPVWRLELARILPELLEPDQLPLPGPEAGWQRRRLFEAITRAIATLGEPFLILVDDLQWCDEETLAWVGAVGTLAPELPLLLLGTARTDEVDPEHPLHQLDPAAAWTTLELGPLEESESREVAEGVAGRAVDRARLRRLHRYAEGSPLIVVESVLAGWLDTAPGDHGTGEARRTPEMPPRIRAVMEHRLAQLSPGARRLADLAATAGRAVEVSLLARAAGEPAHTLVDPFDELWRHRILRRTSSGRWDFTHDRLREGAYGSIPPARRADGHRRIAEALLADKTVDPTTISPQLALHWERAGELPRALEAREQAAAVASRLDAYPEAARHLSEAVRLLGGLPEGTERDAHEAELQVRLGDASVSAKGWANAQAGTAYRRALELARHMDHPHLLGCAMWGVQSYCHVRADFAGVREMGNALGSLGRRTANPDLEALGTYAIGLERFHRGRLEQARQLLLDAAGRPAPRLPGQYGIWTSGGTLQVITHAYLAHVECFRGRCGLAEAALASAAVVADESGSPFPRAIHPCYAAMYWCFRDDPGRCREQLAIAIPICEANDIPYYRAWAAILDGWVVARDGKPARGVELIREGLSRIRETGGRLRWPFYLGLIAQGQAGAGALEEALATLDDAERVVHQHGEEWCLPTLHLVRAEVLREAGDAAAGRASALAALEEARGQGAHLSGLRAVALLAQLDEVRGDPAAARACVGPWLASWPGDQDLEEVQRLREVMA